MNIYDIGIKVPVKQSKGQKDNCKILYKDYIEIYYIEISVVYSANFVNIIQFLQLL